MKVSDPYSRHGGVPIVCPGSGHVVVYIDTFHNSVRGVGTTYELCATESGPSTTRHLL